ncbi:hypothetical protein DM860_012482 [Cuscuta australis]|uniref:Uncharacterized protein n=1 Tax=Cuscuta australis TaxID=267555 RepID=A0A328DGM0_9ASTE|nr:hypothetical protein DM860_012482 [Cuscuta australis]
MAGWNYIPPSALKLDDHRTTCRFPAQPEFPPEVVMEGLIAHQRREIQMLLLNKQDLAASHLCLKLKLSAAQRELQHHSATASAVKASRDEWIREACEKLRITEAEEATASHKIRSELAVVKADLEKMRDCHRELVAHMNEIEDELTSVLSDLTQVMVVKAEIENINKEFQRGRDAIEQERKTKAANLEQRLTMEMHMSSLSAEIERLRVELVDAEKRAMAAAAAALIPSFAQDNGTLHESGYDQNLGHSPFAAGAAPPFRGRDVDALSI